MVFSDLEFGSEKTFVLIFLGEGIQQGDQDSEASALFIKSTVLVKEHKQMSSQNELCTLRETQSAFMWEAVLQIVRGQGGCFQPTVLFMPIFGLTQGPSWQVCASFSHDGFQREGFLEVRQDILWVRLLSPQAPSLD